MRWNAGPLIGTATDVDVEVVADIFKFGVTPVSILMLGIIGYIRFKPETDGLIGDKRELAQRNADLLSVYQNRILPLLEAAVAAGAKSAEGSALLSSVAQDLGATAGELREAVRDLRDMQRELERFVIEERAKPRGP